MNQVQSNHQQQNQQSSLETGIASASQNSAPNGGTPVDEITWATFTEQIRKTTPREFTERGCIVVVAWVCMSMMLFGMNFMLDSFTDSRAASYTTLLSSGLVFFGLALALFLILMLLVHTTELFASAKPAYRGILDSRHLFQLFLLGTVDALGGVTGTYGAPNTPIAVQFTIVATGVVWTFLFARWLVPDRDRPCTPFVFTSVLLTVLGAAVTIIPQWDSMEQLRGVLSSIGWILIFLLASIFPLFLNVMYSRYLVEHVDQVGRSLMTPSNTGESAAFLSPPSGVGSTNIVAVNSDEQQLYEQQQSATAADDTAHRTARNNWPFFCVKLSIALLGDGFFQIIVILLLLPLDFCPWFGAATSPEQTGRWLDQGFADVFENASNPHTARYFGLYVFGFFSSHIMGAALSYYSPQLCAFIYSVNTPMNLILLVIFPAWNVFSMAAPTWASATSIVLTAIGAVMYASWEHGQRVKAGLAGLRVLPPVA